MKAELSGVIAPITTPFRDGAVDLDSLSRNIQTYKSTRLAGYFVLGTNGEASLLEISEKRAVLDRVLKERDQTQFVIAGASHESTHHSIEAARQFASMGADYVSLLAPSYYKKRMTDEALFAYFSAVADESPVPVLLYNAPDYTGISLTPRLVERVSGHGNIRGIKDSSAGSFIQLLPFATPDFRVISGTINTLLPALFLGAAGGVISLADCFPEPCCELFELAIHGQWDQAKDLHLRLLGLAKAVSGSHGVAGVKYAMDVAGMCGGLPRPPVLPLSDEEKASIRAAIRNAALSQ